MSPRARRLLLFAVAFVTLPLPFYLGDVEVSPALRLVFLATLFGSVAAAEGGGTIAALGGLGVAQAIVGVGLLWVGSGLLIRSLERLPRAWQHALLGSVVLALVVGSCLEIYTTSLSSTRPRSSVWHLFE